MAVLGPAVGQTWLCTLLGVEESERINMADDRIVLEGGEAIALWKQGEDAWNAWIDENAEADVSFKGVDFSQHAEQYGPVSFDGYHFPRGAVSFRGAKFGDNDLSFVASKFAKGYLDLGAASFERTRVNFMSAVFEECDVLVINPIFNRARFTFDFARFGGRFVFVSPLPLSPKGQRTRDEEAYSIKKLSFRFCQFQGVVLIEGRFDCIPDLRSTITQGHIDLQNLTVEPIHRLFVRGWGRIGDPHPVNDAVPALRRLKELAEANRHHEAALRFFGGECQAQRWTRYRMAASLLDWAYDLLCDYGQSVARPVIGLFVSIALFVVVYAALASPELGKDIDVLGEAVSASLANTLPFIPSSRTVRTDAFDLLYGTNPGLWIDILSLTQGAIGFVFLFLIGLGLRNRFRM
ncbi:hypothetical protein NUH88_15910 [Nisaea acidiphila]|uniref:Pentapeptide repeat-containing protein n=1 Tax=Nisaea acidiphila TaxID=1862145 RepID=A0A9J7AN59_9PROT|nr:hypothetical protein [Nisaea acidiphila]UUX48880.1 hypothetical protein NUH88_15910 [Nisaea acidiphila]